MLRRIRMPQTVEAWHGCAHEMRMGERRLQGRRHWCAAALMGAPAKGQRSSSGEVMAELEGFSMPAVRLMRLGLNCHELPQ